MNKFGLGKNVKTGLEIRPVVKNVLDDMITSIEKDDNDNKNK